MAYSHFSLNGKILPADQAVIALDNVEYSYGFGVYETIRVTKNKIFFLDDHCRRLINSAKIIGLEHTFTKDNVQKNVQDLVRRNKADTYNVKILLIGGQEPKLYIICLNPLFPDRKLYQNGAKTITYKYEREFPQAKTLNMLSSYLAYREAKLADAYDALLINRKGHILEGTRTNFFAIKGKTLFSPPEAAILPGVMRAKVLEVARQNGYKIVEQDIPLTDIANYDGAFLTSASSKIMPIKSIDNHSWPEISEPLKQLINIFDKALKD